MDFSHLGNRCFQFNNMSGRDQKYLYLYGLFHLIEKNFSVRMCKYFMQGKYNTFFFFKCVCVWLHWSWFRFQIIFVFSVWFNILWFKMITLIKIAQLSIIKNNYYTWSVIETRPFLTVTMKIMSCKTVLILWKAAIEKVFLLKLI